MTVAAGGALIAGGISAMLVRRMRKSWFPFILSFTGGIVLYAAFVKFLPSSEEQLKQILSSNSAFSVQPFVSSSGFLLQLRLILYCRCFKEI
jgi:hypothetical protein